MRTAVASLVVLSFAANAWAQKTPAQRADELNTVGKELFIKQQYRAAAEKFHQATILSPEGRLYWNLCFTRVQLNRLRAALTACNAVEPNGAKDRVIVKSRKMIAELEAKGIAAETKPTNPDGSLLTKTSKTPKATTVSTTNGSTNNNNTGATATGFQRNPTGHDTSVGGPSPGLAKSAPLRYDYSWSLGAEFVTLFDSTIGGDENYDDGGAGVRFHADFPLSKRHGFGVQGYLHLNFIREGVQASTLQIYDAGGAVFKHFHVHGNMYITPVIGGHLSIMQPESAASGSVVFALGFRGALRGALVFGRRSNYMFTVTLDYTRYMSAISESSNLDPMNFGLDKSSGVFGLSAGLIMRFNTPFGVTSIFTLE